MGRKSHHASHYGFPPVGDFASGVVPLAEAASRIALSVPAIIELFGSTSRRDNDHGLLFPADTVAYYAADARPIPVFPPLTPYRMPVQVYAIRSDAVGAVKIGQTKDVQKRLAGLQQGTDAELTLLWHFKAAAWVEEDILRRLAPWRKRGEWFHPSDEVLEWVARQGRFIAHAKSTVASSPVPVALEAGG